MPPLPPPIAMMRRVGPVESAKVCSGIALRPTACAPILRSLRGIGGQIPGPFGFSHGVTVRVFDGPSRWRDAARVGDRRGTSLPSRGTAASNARRRDDAATTESHRRMLARPCVRRSRHASRYAALLTRSDRRFTVVDQ